MSGSGRVRVGVMNYILGRPLVRGLVTRRSDEVEIIEDVPARVGEMLAAGRLDTAIAPVAMILATPGIDVVPGLGVLCDGPVQSIRLFHKTPLSELRRVALDGSSRSGAMLARIVLERFEGAAPEYVRRQPSLPEMLADCDGALLIGDPALTASADVAPYVDLGELWKRHTGLGFVFAMWGLRAGLAQDRREHIAELLDWSLSVGEEELEDIVAEESVRIGLPPEEVRAYLGERIRYRLAPNATSGLRLFARLAVEQALLPPGAGVNLLAVAADAAGPADRPDASSGQPQPPACGRFPSPLAERGWSLAQPRTGGEVGSGRSRPADEEVSPDALQRGITSWPAHASSSADAITSLLEHGDLLELGAAADELRFRLHPEPVVTYVVDRNINYTNVCVSGCRFCAFYRRDGDPDAFVLTTDEVLRKVGELVDAGGTQVLMQGGLHPRLGLDWICALVREIKSAYTSVDVHSLSPPEVVHYARVEGLPVRAVVERLREAGLSSLPGGGAEILSDRVRSVVSPHKCTADEWLVVMREVAAVGMTGTATMVFGHIETTAERAEHLFRVRDLQDETGVFTAFIPWTFQQANTALTDVRPAGGYDYLRTLAASRLALPNIPNIQASWVTQGAAIAQLALRFGANDLGGTMMEENVVAAAGCRFRVSVEELRAIAEEAGFELRQRRTDYTRV